MSRLFYFAFTFKLPRSLWQNVFRDEIFGFGHVGAIQGVSIAFLSARLPF